MSEKVVFFNKYGVAQPIEFDGEMADFIKSIRETVCNPDNQDAKALIFGGEFARKDDKVFTTGGMTGEKENLIRLCVDFILQIAARTPNVPPKYTICEITDTALRVWRGVDAKRRTTKGGLILPK